MANIRLISKMGAVLLLALLAFVMPVAAGWHGLPYVITTVVVIGMFFLIRLHSRGVAYECLSCNQVFAISVWTDFLSPHKSGEKLLRCVHCGHAGWLPEVDRRDISKTSLEAASAKTISLPAGLYVQIVIVAALYALLWLVAISAPVEPDATTWQVLELPLAVGIIPMLHFAFCLFAAHNGYRSRIYPLLTALISLFLIMVILILRL